MISLQGQSRQSASDTPDDRTALALFLKPYHNLISAFRALDPQQQAPDINRCMTTIHEFLSRSSPTFGAAFAEAQALCDVYQSFSQTAELLMNSRQKYYDKDVNSTVESMTTMLKKIPDLDIKSPSAFTRCAKLVEKDMLQAIDLAKSIISSIEKDANEFICTVDSLCSRWSDA